MRTRTLAREAALQYLYEVDLVGRAEAEALDAFLDRQLGRAEARPFAARLVRGVLEKREGLDRVLTEVAENWSLDRMAVVDRNVLRLGAYELLHAEDVPVNVAIDEAINLARRFSTEEACAFVNGILDRISERAAVRESDQEGSPGVGNAEEA